MHNLSFGYKVSPIHKPLHLFKNYLAKHYARLYKKDMFIAIMGSLGKTTCVRACEAVLSQKINVVSSKPNTDPSIALPATLLKITPKVKKVILEMGIEEKGEIDFYLSLVSPATVICTKISYDYSQYLGDLDEIIEEQGKLISQLKEDGIAILNFDDPPSKKLANMCKGSVIFFGTDPNNCTVWAGNIKLENFRTTFELNLGVERVRVNYPLLGNYQIYPALAAAAVGVVNKIPLTKIKIALESIEPTEHKMQVLPGPNGSIILDDTYNSSPASLEAAVDTLLQISARRRVVVLGEMRDLGKFSEQLHRQAAQKIFKDKIDLIFLGQGDAQIIAEELRSLGFWDERVHANLQNSQIVGKLLKTLGKGDVVLIKAARAVRLDEVVKRITKKT